MAIVMVGHDTGAEQPGVESKLDHGSCGYGAEIHATGAQ
jgi:hypothetical protein